MHMLDISIATLQAGARMGNWLAADWGARLRATRDEYAEPRINPIGYHPPTFDPLAGFENGRKVHFDAVDASQHRSIIVIGARNGRHMGGDERRWSRAVGTRLLRRAFSQAAAVPAQESATRSPVSLSTLLTVELV